MAYEHGVNITENKTSLSTPVTALSGISIVVGTAPVHMVGGKVNEPILAYSYAEAVSALGYSDDWAKYTLCEVIYSHFVLYQVAPVVFVNTLDPAVNITHIAAASYDLADGKIKLPFDAVADSLTVKDAPGGSTVYVKGTDYDLLYTEDNLVIEVLPGGDIAADATALLLEFNVIDLTGFDKNDIIGGYDVNTKKSSGLELVDAVFPKFTIVPDIILAPGYSDDAEVAAVMAAKAASINGSFRANALIDGDTTTVRHYSDVPEWKNAQNITSKEQILLWPMVKLGDRIFHASVQAAALMAQVDTYNGGNPSESPSNKKLQANAAVLADGTEVYLDKPTANYLNSNGIVTALNFIGGFRLWGNFTACYPANTDVKDYMIPISRMFKWVGNSLVLTYWGRVDERMTPRYITSITDSVNIWLNGLTTEGTLLGGRVEFREEENPITALMSGKIKLHLFLTPPVPGQEIEFVLEYDVSYLSALFVA